MKRSTFLSLAREISAAAVFHEQKDKIPCLEVGGLNDLVGSILENKYGMSDYLLSPPQKRFKNIFHMIKSGLKRKL